MPNYEAIKDRIIELTWKHEGNTTDGTMLISCPLCGSAVPWPLKQKHAWYHARKEEE